MFLFSSHSPTYFCFLFSSSVRIYFLSLFMFVFIFLFYLSKPVHHFPLNILSCKISIAHRVWIPKQPDKINMRELHVVYLNLSKLAQIGKIRPGINVNTLFLSLSRAQTHFIFLRKMPQSHTHTHKKRKEWSINPTSGNLHMQSQSFIYTISTSLSLSHLIFSFLSHLFKALPKLWFFILLEAFHNFL